MRVRLIRKLADEIDGVDLRESDVGDLLDLGWTDARVLIAEGWATPARRAADARRGFPQSVDAERPRRSSIFPTVGSVAPGPCAKCGSDQVKVALTAGDVIYYRCLGCQDGWSEPERRRQPREAHIPERRKAS
jgi:hypothetical protein